LPEDILKPNENFSSMFGSHKPLIDKIALMLYTR
jgi:hypothetical protein